MFYGKIGWFSENDKKIASFYRENRQEQKKGPRVVTKQANFRIPSNTTVVGNNEKYCFILDEYPVFFPKFWRNMAKNCRNLV